MPSFPQNFVHFGCFTNEVECECEQDLSNKVIVLNATSVLVFQYKNASFIYTKNIIQVVNFNWSTKTNLQRKSLICSP